jgi:hypothetical protein
MTDLGVSRWKMLNTWERDLPGLSHEQLQERLQLARDYEVSSNRPGMGRNPKGAREWRRRREAVEEELERRRASM